MREPGQNDIRRVRRVRKSGAATNTADLRPAVEFLSRNPLTTNDGDKLDLGAGIASRSLER